jgi:hypothetical protein
MPIRIFLLCMLVMPWIDSNLSSAADRVVFDDGRNLIVERLEIRGSVTVLELQGGGRIAIPSRRIVSVRPHRETPAPADRKPETGEDEPWRRWAGEYADMIASAAEKHRLDPALLTAVARVESNFDPYAVSDKGACGILQLTPDTAERFGVEDIFDPEQNIEGGASYLRWLLDRFEGRTDLALAAYNAGENAVDRYQGIPPYSETRNYVARVMDRAGKAAPRAR